LAGTDIIGSVGALAADEVVDLRAMLMGNEMIGWLKRLANGIETTEEDIPLKLMMEVGTGPVGGNYLATDHTRRLYGTKTFAGSAATNVLSRDAWIGAGKQSQIDRAAKLVTEKIAEHKPRIAKSKKVALRELIAEICDREGVDGDEAKELLDATYLYD
jgi:trimethylamine:corrinoid methyltransferase-like protein